MSNNLTQAEVRKQLSDVGLTFRGSYGEFRVGVPGEPNCTYFTSDLRDALATGLDMAFRRQTAADARVKAANAAPVRYWIQEQAPAGNFADSVGLRTGCSDAEAITRFRAWQSSYPEGVFRLITRTDTVVLS